MGQCIITIGSFLKNDQLFEKFPSGYRIQKATSIPHSYTLIESELKKQYVSVILDLLIPEEDGFLVLETIKTRFPLVEVICLVPKLSHDWVIESLRLGAYCVETYAITHEVLRCYLDQISRQCDVFKIAEKVCKENLIQEMELRISLAQEFLTKRRNEGKTLTQNELSVFFPLKVSDQKEYDFLNHKLQQLEKKSAPYTILLVEDDVAISTELQSILFGLTNGKLTLAPSVKEAKELLAKNIEFQVAILDIGLNDGSGIELIRPILDLSAATEVIMLTAFKDMDRITTCFDYGASDYIVKPFNSIQFQHIITKAAQRAVYKSFIPTDTWAANAYTPQNIFETQLSLFQELVILRKKREKKILMKEFTLFFPNLRHHQPPTENGISPEFLSKGIAPFLLDFIQKNKIPLSESDLSILELFQNKKS